MRSDWEDRTLDLDLHEDLLSTSDLSVLLLKFENTQNRQRYIYLAVPQEMYNEFMRKRTKGGFNYSEYGEILAAGDGEPPQRLRLAMARLYNVIVPN